MDKRYMARDTLVDSAFVQLGNFRYLNRQKTELIYGGKNQFFNSNCSWQLYYYVLNSKPGFNHKSGAELVRGAP
eukprot:4740714-Pleurochrysis_carterae.AAC.1